MKVYACSGARQRLASLLERALREGAVRIRRKDGTVFVLRRETPKGSPPDVPPVKLRLDRAEILRMVREGRRPA